jgi:hypothetical protein
MVKLLIVDLVRSSKSGASDGHFGLSVLKTGDVGGRYCSGLWLSLERLKEEGWRWVWVEVVFF